MNFICQLQLQKGIKVLKKIYKQIWGIAFQMHHHHSIPRRSEKNYQVAKKQSYPRKIELENKGNNEHSRFT